MADKYKWASLNIVLPDGTPKRLRFTGATQEEADGKRDKAKIRYDAGLLVINTKTTLRRWYEEWRDVYKKPKVQNITLNEIERIFNKVFLPYIGNVKLCDLRSIHIQKCLNKLEGMSASYIHKCYTYIKACLNKAPQGTMAYDPMRGIDKDDLPRAKKKVPRRPLTEEERKYFLRAIQTHHRGDFFGLIYACGVRPQEARALPIFNVDLKKQRVTIKDAVESGTRRSIKEPKSDAGNRTIPIPDWYMPALTAAVKEAIATGSPYVFHNTKNDIIGDTAMYKAWHSLMRDMDLLAGAKTYRNAIVAHALPQDLDPYNLRHDYCTRLAEDDINLKTAQYWMGHSDIRMTAEIYTHVTNLMIDRAAPKAGCKGVAR